MRQSSGRVPINLIHLTNFSILEQLHLEEALLRADTQNWCLINTCPSSAIVMGISAKPEEVVDFAHLQRHPVPLIRRFTGGGTVLIDENCLMATFIFNQTDIGVPCYPHPVFQWSESFYRPIFDGMNFNLHENDYVIGHQKFAGNAQYMTKHRWLHHTSFLWDYDIEKMSCLKMPPKMPIYRNTRSHQEFLCKLKKFLSKEDWEKKMLAQLRNLFEVRNVLPLELNAISSRPHRRVSAYVE